MEQKILCFGEILWDILPAGAMPGGAPMNVAYHLKNLGLSPSIITRVGEDERGKKIVGLLQEKQIAIAHIQTDHLYPTGLVDAKLVGNNEVVYEIKYPAAWDFIEGSHELEDEVEAASHFIFGSLAARSERSRTTLLQLLEAANQKVLDINLRPPHFDKNLIFELLTRADILKLNEHEIDIVSAWSNSFKNVYDQLKALQEKFSLKAVLLTQGEKGSILYENGNFFDHKGYVIKVVDTIGSGDAFLAGFLSQHIRGSGADEALSFANALGAFVATKAGAWPRYEIGDIYQIMSN